MSNTIWISLIIYFYLNGLTTKYERGYKFIYYSLFGTLAYAIYIVYSLIKETLLFIDNILSIRFAYWWKYTNKYSVISWDYHNRVSKINTKNPIKKYWIKKIIERYNLQSK